MPTRCNRWFLLQILLLAQHVSGTNMPIIRSSIVLYRWLLPVVFGVLVLKLSVLCGAEGCLSGLRAAFSITLYLLIALDKHNGDDSHQRYRYSFQRNILRKRSVSLIKYSSVHKHIPCMFLIGNFFSLAQQHLVSQDLLNIEVSRSHAMTHIQ